MERDFMGLNLKEPLAVVKGEITDGGKDSAAFTKGSGMQWPFSNKVSALSQFVSFKVAQEDSSKKMGSDAFDPSHKQSTGDIQKTFNHDRQGGTHFSMTAYPMQHDANSLHRAHDVKVFPSSSQAVAISMGNPFFKTHFATTGQNASIAMKQQLLGGVPVTGPPSIFPSVGSTEQGNNFKASGAPAQMTIFYGGTVNVYDDISPEKAQAIMFLAGNGSSMASNMAHSRAQGQAPTQKTAADDGVLVSQPMNTPPTSALSSPESISSYPGAQSGSGSTSNDEMMAAKPVAMSSTPVSKVATPNIVGSMGAVAASTMMPSAVPQARKASLARFLEKRKERTMNTAPYNLGNKKSPEGSNGTSLSGISGAVAGSL